MRRVVPVCLGALASLFVLGMTHATAQQQPDPTTPTTTTSPASTVIVNTTTTTTGNATTTTVRSATTTTTRANGGRPIPPPAAGPTQTLVPDLLGTPLEIPTTTSTSTDPFTPFTRGTVPTNITTPIATSSDSPSGFTLILAAVAWLASFGGLLVYAEERRSSRWKHLAR